MFMNSVELKVPPPLVGLLAAAMYGIAWAVPPFPLATAIKAAAAVLLALAGGAIDVAGLIAFRRAKTTINPLKPQNSSSLVSGGIYRYTRNPMYLGMLSFLVAWAVYLAQPLALVGPLGFVLYITRFQIVPEERVLSGLFGEEFAAYKARVRRWL
jgi:protein-S-isoprenylcysteine O-methyltransferase Ste14